MTYAQLFKNISFYINLYTARLGAILRPFWHRGGPVVALWWPCGGTVVALWWPTDAAKHHRATTGCGGPKVYQRSRSP